MYLPRTLISHLYTHFLRSVSPQTPPVLLLSSLEPDAICACRILTALFKRDFIPHKLHPISGYADLQRAGEDLVRPMKTTEGGSGGVVICLGVGGMVDLASMLGLEDEDSADSFGGIEVWVFDARRPWNLANVFGSTTELTTPEENSTSASRKRAGVDKGCIQRGYRPGKGGIVVFDDGDISDELNAERDAYWTLAEMPEIEDDDRYEEDEEEEEHVQDEAVSHETNSKKRKSWSDREIDDEGDSADDDERPQQRRRSNSGSSIASSSRNRTPPSSQPSSSPSRQPPKKPTAKQLRQKLLDLRHSHESILHEYNKLGTSYSEPISSLAYSLASELGREDNDLLWLAIVGVSSLELSGQTSTGLGTSSRVSDNSLSHVQHHRSWRRSRSAQVYALLRDEVRRLNPPPLTSSPYISPTFGPSTSPSDTSIRLSPDPCFPLLRHWSLFDSMLHSPYVAARLRVWNDSGVRRLRKLLAKMGISLVQSNQIYTHMDIELKRTLRDKLSKYAGTYNLDEIVPAGDGRATYQQEGWGFIRTWGWKAQLSAVDVGVILAAMLDVGTDRKNTSRSANQDYAGSSQRTNAGETEDIPERSESLIPRFFAAYDAMAPAHPTKLIDSISTAQHLLRSIMNAGSVVLNKRQIRHLRAYQLAVIKDGPDLALFSESPGALVKLALWIGECISVQAKEDGKEKHANLPLVLAAYDEKRGVYLLVGVGTGGAASAASAEAKKEKEEKKRKHREEKQQQRKEKEAEKERKAAERAERGEDDADEDEASEEEADDDDDDSDSESEDEDDDGQRTDQKRGFGNNRFGIAFQEVTEETNARVKIDSFDHCVVEVKKEDLQGFLESLSLKSVVGC